MYIQEDFEEFPPPEEDVHFGTNTGSTLDLPWHQPGNSLSTQMAGASRSSFSALTSPQTDQGQEGAGLGFY